MATHSSIFAWRIPWTEEPGRLQSTNSQHQSQSPSHLRTLIGGLQSLMTVTSSFTDMAGNIPSLYAFSSGHVWM